MSEINKNSLTLMDEYLESISDEDFLSEYLKVEKNQGQTIDELLNAHIFYKETYTEVSVCLGSEELKAEQIETEELHSEEYDYSYSANDDSYELAA